AAAGSRNSSTPTSSACSARSPLPGASRSRIIHSRSTATATSPTVAATTETTARAGRSLAFGEHLPRVLAAGAGELRAAQPAGDLVDPLVALDFPDPARRGRCARGLGDAVLMVGACRNLRQVGDAQHLA